MGHLPCLEKIAEDVGVIDMAQKPEIGLVLPNITWGLFFLENETCSKGSSPAQETAAKLPTHPAGHPGQ